jgi:hypothetical protein
MSDDLSGAFNSLHSRIANLHSVVLSEVADLNNRVERVSGMVDSVQSDIQMARSDLEKLYKTFTDYVELDKLSKQLQLAETRVVKIRQELDTKFGKYQEVRDVAIGLLQAVDLNLIRQETMRSSTEELLLKLPRYWMGPALVSLSAWVSDNRPLAERAMQEAMQRDENKACLFYSLVSRRGRRPTPSLYWLQRYLLLQDPTALERETVVLLDGITGGVFGVHGKTVCFDCIEVWLKELSQRSGFIEEQRKQWVQAFEEKKVPPMPNEFPYLQKYSSNWSVIRDSIMGVRLHSILHGHFTKMFEGELEVAPTVKHAVDSLLESLVTKFDDEELPYREEERRLTLIIEENGDEDKATQRFGLEKKSFETVVSFTQMLTNAALRPDTTGTSLATRRFAVALSSPWIAEAHTDLTAKTRKGIVQQVELAIDDWKGVTKDGANENELVQSIVDFLTKKEADELARHIFLSGSTIGIGLAGFFLSFLAGFPGMLIPWIGVAVFLFFRYQGIEKTRKLISANYEKRKIDCSGMVRALCAEVVEFCNLVQNEDAKAEPLQAYIKTITPDQHMQSRYQTERSILN